MKSSREEHPSRLAKAVSTTCRVGLAFYILFSLSACGEIYHDESIGYSSAAIEALVNTNVCKSAADCQKRELVFWEGGNPWIPSLKKVFINIYQVHDVATVDAVTRRITETKEKTGGPQCQITAYSSSHGESKVLLKQVLVE